LAGTVLPIPDSFDAFKGPAAVTQHELVSLEDLFGADFAECFHASPEFRSSLIGSAPDVGSLFSRGTPWATPELDDEGCRGRLGGMLSWYLGAAAPTADEFVDAFTALCGFDSCWGRFKSFERKPPPGALEWHQDWACAELAYAYEKSRTVMFAFPARGSRASDHEGTGIFSELVRLTHEFSTESLKGTSDYLGLSTEEMDMKAAAALGVSEEYVVRPVFRRGQEILVYKDAEHLHRSPRSTSDPGGRARQAIWRFQ